jgi:formamidopyrimidine-DNA glycosylase
MPELPDVEVYRRYINSTSLNQKIKNVQIEDVDILHDISSRSFQIKLKGEKFKSAQRHGKYLFIELKRDELLLMHFGMTGKLKYFKYKENEPDYSKIIFDFANGFHLSYICPRKLGKAGLIINKDKFILENKLGPDPFKDDFKLRDFRELFEGRRGKIKFALMNQKVIAGIGNVYSDEILFQAGIYPFADIKNLSGNDLKEIYKQLTSVIKRVINANADSRKFPESFLVTRRRDGEKCPKCGGTIRQKKYSNRSAYYCKDHQNG